MAALSPHYFNVHSTAPTLQDYFTVTVLHDPRAYSASSSRPSSSSSNSSYASPASATYTDASLYGSSRSASWATFPEGLSPHSPYHTGRPRPLPTPPTPTESPHASPRASLPPRPLPHPPLARPHSETRPARRSNPLPTPPLVPESAPLAASPPPPHQQLQPQTAPAPQSASSAAAVTVVAGPAVATRPAPSARPVMSLTIPGASSAGNAPQLRLPTPLSPLSPIAFDFPGPRELRKRREEELDRCMKDLGFVEAPPASAKSKPGRTSSEAKPRLGRHTPASSVSSVEESDQERDVVLLVDNQSDEENEEPPMRSESRAAMRTLFSDIDMAPSPLVEHPLNEIEVDVQVEIVSKKAAARTRRRYSRKWIREKSGKRWTEKDFSEILSQLRKLR